MAELGRHQIGWIGRSGRMGYSNVRSASPRPGRRTVTRSTNANPGGQGRAAGTKARLFASVFEAAPDIADRDPSSSTMGVVGRLRTTDLKAGVTWARTVCARRHRAKRPRSIFLDRTGSTVSVGGVARGARRGRGEMRGHARCGASPVSGTRGKAVKAGQKSFSVSSSPANGGSTNPALPPISRRRGPGLGVSLCRGEGDGGACCAIRSEDLATTLPRGIVIRARPRSTVAGAERAGLCRATPSLDFMER